MTAAPIRATVAALLEARELPLKVQKWFQLRDVREGVVIPYRDLDGNVDAWRVRENLDLAHPMVWTDVNGTRLKGGNVLLYVHPDSFKAACKNRRAAMCEGETDQWTLTVNGIAAYGVPGASMVRRCLLREHVEELNRIDAVREPGAGGILFIKLLIARLLELGWIGELYVVDLQGTHGFKDPSAMHVDNPERFKARWKAAVAFAELVQIAAPKEPAPANAPQLVSALNFVDWDTVRIEPVRWLMSERLPLAELTIVEGAGGLGKTTALLDIAARLSRGSEMPDGTPSEASAVVVVAQEDRAGIIKARLLAAGADLAQIGLLESVGDDRHFFTLPGDAKALLESVRSQDAKLVVIDALFSHFDPDINAHNAQDVRRALTPLSEIAHSTKAAVVGIRHWGKGVRSAADRGMGSVDIRNVARSVLTVAKHPAEDGRIVVAVSKSNLGQACRALAFTLEAADVPGDDDAPSVSVGRVAWGEEVEISADELANTGPPLSEDGVDRDVADDFLRDFLDAPKRAGEVFAAGKQAGLNRRTIQRAAKRVHVVIERRGFGTGSWWSPPSCSDASIRDTEPHSRHGFAYDANGTSGVANAIGPSEVGIALLSFATHPRHIDDTVPTDVTNVANGESVTNDDWRSAARSGDIARGVNRVHVMGTGSEPTPDAVATIQDVSKSKPGAATPETAAPESVGEHYGEVAKW